MAQSPADALDILYQDSSLVAVNKPAGLLVHRTREDLSAQEFALQLTRDRLGQRVYPVHRLDRPTSGLLLFALSPESAAQLSRLFRERQVEKRYLAVVRGHPPKSLQIDHPLSDPDSHTLQRRLASTRLRRLGSVEWPDRVDRYPSTRYALVETIPETGRRHQIRRHLKHISHPIIGDTSYGKSRHNRYFQQRFGFRRLALHAWSLRFHHPVSQALVHLSAPLEPCFLSLLDACGWALPESKA